MNAVSANFDDVQNVAIEPKSLEVTYNTMQHAGSSASIDIRHPVYHTGLWIGKMVEEKKSIGRRWGVMKQKKTMVILILILAVLAPYMAAEGWGKKAAEKEAGAAAEKITVMDLKNLSSFSYSNGQETMSFVKEDGTWKLEDDKEIRLNQSTVESIGEAAGGPWRQSGS